ncbi:hypothetical protein GBAR_LOCUS16556 [Geodia barretti]|uniref:Uncharacterized protein n=1 Tax=Geodia barretti TaxID=519541 RepID=A0AA35WPJ9_GEOBA|nr:hypothetical protein GBAR_LOCUS16556 [Geodia barretti]
MANIPTNISKTSGPSSKVAATQPVKATPETECIITRVEPAKPVVPSSRREVSAASNGPVTCTETTTASKPVSQTSLTANVNRVRSINIKPIATITPSTQQTVIPKPVSVTGKTSSTTTATSVPEATKPPPTNRVTTTKPLATKPTATTKTIPQKPLPVNPAKSTISSAAFGSSQTRFGLSHSLHPYKRYFPSSQDLYGYSSTGTPPPLTRYSPPSAYAYNPYPYPPNNAHYGYPSLAQAAWNMSTINCTSRTTGISLSQ